MMADEFAGYVAYFVPDYAAEISSNYDVDMKTAQARAENAVEVELGMGVETPGQILLCATVEGDESGAPVGYIWCQSKSEEKIMFISDFCILPKYRGRGYGQSALKALEIRYSDSAYDEIRLRVAIDNKIAERMYLKAGYLPTGINMRRPIGDT
jgi:ribosomal protein S18 acetylase RimI-like enzyme